MPGIRRILFIKPSSLGDIVHALPAFAALRARYPDADITWLVKKQWAPLLSRVEGLNRVWPVEGRFFHWLAQVPSLRAEQFDVTLDLQGLLRSALVARLCGAPVRVGFAAAREGSPAFYTRRVTVPSRDMHAVDRYLSMVRTLDVPTQPPQFPLRRSADDDAAIMRLLQEAGVPPAGRCIAMNPSARWVTKRWPPARFAAVADALQERGFGRIVLVGGRDDRSVGEEIKALMRSRAADLIGRVELQLLPTLFRSVSALISNDSGPVHIAAAVGTPVVAVFGPTDPARTGPYGTGHVVLTADVGCRPCFDRVCRQADQLTCLTSIIPADVVQAVERRLIREATPTSVLPVGGRA
jgi:lipopolysaccharide heptosyltransferase I